MEGCVCVSRERETERQRDRETERQRDRETERQRDRETDRQRDRETERQRDRETERQRDRERESYMYNIYILHIIYIIKNKDVCVCVCMCVCDIGLGVQILLLFNHTWDDWWGWLIFLDGLPTRIFSDAMVNGSHAGVVDCVVWLPSYLVTYGRLAPFSWTPTHSKFQL